MEQPAVKEKYKNQKECARATGISIAHLKLAKRNGAPGFYENGQIDFTLLGPWWKDNQHAVINKGKDEYTVAKTRKMVADAGLAELAEAEKKGRTLDKDEVLAFVYRLMAASNAISKTKFVNELPSKTLGCDIDKTTALNAQAHVEVCNEQQRLTLEFLKNQTTFNGGSK